MQSLRQRTMARGGGPDMRLLMLTRYGTQGASSRVRSYQYVPHLAANGVTVTTAPLFTNEYVKRLYEDGGRSFRDVVMAYVRRVLSLIYARRFTLVWVEKELFPWFPSVTETALAALRVPLIVDYDDAVFHNYDSHPRRLVRAVLGRKIDRVMASADVVIAGNKYIAKRAFTAGARRVVVLPSVVDVRLYPPLRPVSKVNKVFRIGWIGTPVTERYLHPVIPAIRRVARESEVVLVLIGGTGVNTYGIRTEVHEWSSATEVDLLSSIDVGIMPLSDEPWERGKCGYKLVQYMAAAKPVVASPVGVNVELVRHGENGLLARTEEEWVHALQTLRDRLDVRASMGRVGRKLVEEEYSLQVTAPRLLELLRNAVRGWNETDVTPNL